MKKYWFILIMAILLVLPKEGWAQDDCMNTLRKAKQLYEQGLIDDIPKILSPCLQSGFTRAQQIEAFKLIILTYLFDDNQYEAEKSMDEFLRSFPEYEVMPSDPVEFVYLLQSYKTSLLYSINLFVGTVVTTRRIIEPYTVLDQNQSTLQDKAGTGFQLGLGLSKNLHKGFAANVDLTYSFQNFSYSRESNILLGSDKLQFVKIQATEKLNKLGLPVSLTYSFGKHNINYLLRGGGEIGYITKTLVSLEKSGISSDYDIKNQVNNYYYAALVGCGLQYKVTRGFLVVDLRYEMGLNNMTVTSERFSNPSLLSNYFFINDDFAMNLISLNIGYYFSIYQSKKKKK